MSPSIHAAPSRSTICHLLVSAASLFGGRGHSAETLRGLDARTLADIGIAQVGQGPESLHFAMTDTRKLEVRKSLGMPSAE
jgi:hypothetical protein